MKTKNIVFSILLSLIMTFSSAIFVSAETLSPNISLTPEQQTNIFEDLREQILFKYGDIYSFDHFSFVFKNERVENGKILIDVDLYADMTLIRHPADSPFINGIAESLSAIDDGTERAIIQDKIDGYINEIETLYYNKPEYSVFSYSIAINERLAKASLRDNFIHYDLFYRTDITDEEVILEPVSKLEKAENSFLAKEIGKGIIEEIQPEPVSPMAAAAAFYDRIAARDYALNNATAAPEFSGSGNSDCANFVSKSLNAGGISEDKSGGWYRATTYGNVGTCGINWMRTGYNNNGGVVPYMTTTKGYFYKETDKNKVFAGSIMYWTGTSHVALVTYGDTVTIKYTQHSNYQLSSTEATKVYQSEAANFYLPYSSIMK